MVIAAVQGGINSGDSSEVLTPTWAMAHRNFACVFPNAGTGGHIYAAPLYSIVTALISALLRIGHSVPFPTLTHSRGTCAGSIPLILNWASRSGATHPTMLIGYMAPFVLLLGALSIFAVTPIWGTPWEVIVLVALALTPAIYSSFIFYFHPQDLLAVGLLLVAVAAVLSHRWALGGILLGFAFTAQQFALLVVILLVVIAPSDKRGRLALGASAAILSVTASLTLIALPSQRMSVLRTILLGSDRIVLGTNHFASDGGTVLFAANLHGDLLFVISRIMPLLAVGALALWAYCRLGSCVLKPVIMLSLVGLSFSARLVFEENLFAYYFLAVAVMMILVDATVGHLRASTLTWLSVQEFGLYPTSGYAPKWVVIYTIVVARTIAMVIIVGVVHSKIRWGALVYLTFVAVSNQKLVSVVGLTMEVIPKWVWQVILVPWAIGFFITSIQGELHRVAVSEMPVGEPRLMSVADGPSSTPTS